MHPLRHSFADALTRGCTHWVLHLKPVHPSRCTQLQNRFLYRKIRSSQSRAVPGRLPERPDSSLSSSDPPLAELNLHALFRPPRELFGHSSYPYPTDHLFEAVLVEDKERTCLSIHRLCQLYWNLRLHLEHFGLFLVL